MTKAFAFNPLDPVAALQGRQDNSEPAVVPNGEPELREGIGVRLLQRRDDLLGVHVVLHTVV